MKRGQIYFSEEIFLLEKCTSQIYAENMDKVYKSISRQCEGFEWDDGNINQNWLKYEVSPAECEQTSFNRPLVIHDDIKDSEKEQRFYALGRTDSKRNLFIAFTFRHKRIRVISARDMSRKEREVYRNE